MSASKPDPIVETIAGLVDELFEMLGSGEVGRSLCIYIICLILYEIYTVYIVTYVSIVYMCSIWH